MSPHQKAVDLAAKMIMEFCDRLDIPKETQVAAMKKAYEFTRARKETKRRKK